MSDQWDSMLAAAAGVPDVDVLTADELQTVVRHVIERFVADSGSRWWWEHLRGPSKSIAYEDDPFALLASRIEPDSQLILLLTNESPVPEGAVRGSMSSLREIVFETTGCEYALLPPSLDWIVFDTHHNTLVGTESAPIA